MQQGWLRNQDAAPDRLAKYFNALGLFAEIVEAVYEVPIFGPFLRFWLQK
jgi:hypothetical protein